MNQKLAKKIRKHIRSEFPATTDENRYLPNKYFSAQQPIDEIKDGVQEYKEIFWTQSIRLDTKSAHGAYKQAKKLVKRYSLEVAFYG